MAKRVKHIPAKLVELSRRFKSLLLEKPLVGLSLDDAKRVVALLPLTIAFGCASAPKKGYEELPKAPQCEEVVKGNSYAYALSVLISENTSPKEKAEALEKLLNMSSSATHSNAENVPYLEPNLEENLNKGENWVKKYLKEKNYQGAYLLLEVIAKYDQEMVDKYVVEMLKGPKEAKLYAALLSLKSEDSRVVNLVLNVVEKEALGDDTLSYAFKNVLISLLLNNDIALKKYSSKVSSTPDKFSVDIMKVVYLNLDDRERKEDKEIVRNSLLEALVNSPSKVAGDLVGFFRSTDILYNYPAKVLRKLYERYNRNKEIYGKEKSAEELARLRFKALRSLAVAMRMGKKIEIKEYYSLPELDRLAIGAMVGGKNYKNTRDRSIVIDFGKRIDEIIEIRNNMPYLRDSVVNNVFTLSTYAIIAYINGFYEINPDAKEAVRQAYENTLKKLYNKKRWVEFLNLLDYAPFFEADPSGLISELVKRGDVSLADKIDAVERYAEAAELANTTVIMGTLNQLFKDVEGKGSTILKDLLIGLYGKTAILTLYVKDSVDFINPLAEVPTGKVGHGIFDLDMWNHIKDNKNNGHTALWAPYYIQALLQTNSIGKDTVNNLVKILESLRNSLKGKEVSVDLHISYMLAALHAVKNYDLDEQEFSIAMEIVNRTLLDVSKARNPLAFYVTVSKLYAVMFDSTALSGGMKKYKNEMKKALEILIEEMRETEGRGYSEEELEKILNDKIDKGEIPKDKAAYIASFYSVFKILEMGAQMGNGPAQAFLNKLYLNLFE